MKDAYYFPHDSNAKDDPKCTLLIEQLGLEGYGIFWVLIEILREQPDYKYPLILLPSIARKYNTTLAKINVVVNKFELFEIENDSFFLSKSLINRMAPLDARKRALSEAGKRGNVTKWGLSSGGDRNKKRREENKEEILLSILTNETHFEDSEINELFIEHLRIRKKIKAVNSRRAIDMLKNRLRELSDSNKNIAIKILNNAIINSWKSYYPLKKDEIDY